MEGELQYPEKPSGWGGEFVETCAELNALSPLVPPPLPRNSSPGGSPVSLPEAGQSAFLWPENYAEGEFQDLLLALADHRSPALSYLYLLVDISAFIGSP